MSPEASSAKFKLSRYRSPQTVIGRFVAKRSLKSACLWAIIIGIYAASKILGFAKLYPTATSRAKVVSSFSNNIGLTAILGKPHDLASIGGYAAWNTIGVVSIVVSIWALLLATKSFRGEEDSGRWELLLAGQTSARRATANVLLGLSASILMLYAIVAICFMVIGHNSMVNYSVSAALFFALAAVIGAGVFMSVGALASQLMPTRSKAAGLSAGVFGLCFLVRAMGDISSMHWLVDLSPLGWIEKLQPLYAPKVVWLLPLAGFILVMSSLSVYLAGKRDLDDSIFNERSSVKAHFRLLNSPLSASIRLTRMASLGWIAAIGLMSLFYGMLTKSAAQALQQSTSTQHAFNKIVHSNNLSGSTVFISIAFLLYMLVMMAYCASSVGRMREEEAEGYLDNFLVRPVSRISWLSGRVFVVTMSVIILAAVSTIGSYIGEISQHAGIGFHPILLAGLNSIAPAVFTLGAGILAMGFMPRLTSVVVYAVIGWSFLIDMVSSGLNLSHWLLDTSIFTHVKLAPATSPNWQADLIIIGLGIILYGLGASRFNSRDLASE